MTQSPMQGGRPQSRPEAVFTCKEGHVFLAEFKGAEAGRLPGGASLVAQMVKNLPAMQETWVPSLIWEDSLEKEMAIHSRILAWRIPWTEEPGGLQSLGLQSRK